MLRLAGMRLVVHNDDVRLDRGVLVVGNHVSWIDIYVINAWRPTPFVSKAEVRGWPIVGWLAHQLGTVFVHRAQFETEFGAMKSIWEKVMATRGTMASLRPIGSTAPERR